MDDMIYKVFGAYIKEARITKGLSQQEVADRLGIKQNAYSRFEKATCKITLPVMLELEHILGINLSEFFYNYNKKED